MATTRDIVYRALKEIRLIASGETPTAEEAKDALDKLNGIMHDLANNGLSYEHTDLTLNDTFPFPDSLINPSVMWLAMNISGLFRLDLSQKQFADAMDGEEAIFAAYLEIPDSSFDTGLVRLPSNRKYWGSY